MKFKIRLKELRVEKNISQAKLAKALNYSQNSISSWETGIRQPDFDNLELLCKFFEVSADYLLGLID